MLKKATTALFLSIIITLLSGCYEPQEPSLPYTPNIAEITFEAEIEDDVESEIEIAVIANETAGQEPVEIPQRRVITQPTVESDETPEPPTNPLPSPQPTESPMTQSTPQPTITPKPQQTPAQTQISTASSNTPQQPSEPPPAPTPEPVPEPTATPVQASETALAPTPEPKIARTICNTCGADITGNVAEHGTVHMLNDENFSYRIE